MRKYLAPQSFVGLNGLQLCLGDLGYQVGWLAALMRNLRWCVEYLCGDVEGRGSSLDVVILEETVNEGVGC
jgi:hypothetical protein